MVVAAPPLKAVGYIRVSTPEQAGEQHSLLQTQETRIKAYCIAHSYSYVFGFTDVLSGRKDNRVEYRRMIEFALQCGADVIIVQFLDRFGRNPQEILSRIWEFRQHRVELLTTDEDIKDELMLLIRAGLAGAESRRNSERVRSYMARSVEKGVHMGRAPYGYRRTRINDQVTWEQEPQEAEIVREMYRLSVAENLGYRSIADWLNAAGPPTRGGGVWAGFTVQHILTNEALGGTLVYGK